MKLNAEALAKITQTTLGHYQERAEAFWQGTRDHDVSQNYAALLSALPERQKLRLLDFGCGPGRDLKYFAGLGHEVIGLDGSANFCEMARTYTGCEVWQQNFLTLDLPTNYFDGIFANASLFHVPRQELPRVLKAFHQSLKSQGVLFSSNPRGESEGWYERRYGAYFELEEYQIFLQKAGFEIIDHYYRPPGRPRDEQPWLAVVSRKSVAKKLTEKKSKIDEKL